MARPITWQDVVAPKGGAVAAEATLRAGRAIQDAVTGFGQIAGDARTAIQKSATDAALATIANSDDPLAAAANVPQNNWRFDPLAIAGAANARNDQLQKAKVTEAQLRASNLQADVAQASLDDRIAEREGAALAEPGIQQIWQTGQMPTFEPDDPRAKTAAGLYAQKAWRDEFDRYNKNKLDQDRLALERVQARVAQQNAAEGKALKDATGELVTFYGSPEGAAADPATVDQKIGEIFGKYGLSMAYIDQGRAAAQLGIAGNKPTEAQLDTVDEKTGLSGRQVLNQLTLQEQAAEANRNAKVSRFDTALRGADLMANNKYRDLTGGDAAQLLLKENPQIGSGLAPNWSTNDVLQRAKTIQAEADKRGTPITQAQAMSLVEYTIGNTTPFDTVGIFNDRVYEGIKSYGALNKEGGVDEVKRKVAAVDAVLAKEQGIIARQRQQVGAWARDPSKPLDPGILKSYTEDPLVKQQSLTQELDMLRGNLAQLGAAVQRGEAISPQVLIDLQKQISAKQRQLDALR